MCQILIVIDKVEGISECFICFCFLIFQMSHRVNKIISDEFLFACRLGLQ